MWTAWMNEQCLGWKHHGHRREGCNSRCQPNKAKGQDHSRSLLHETFGQFNGSPGIMVHSNQSTRNSVTDMENAHNHEGPTRDAEHLLSSAGRHFLSHCSEA